MESLKWCIGDTFVCEDRTYLLSFIAPCVDTSELPAYSSLSTCIALPESDAPVDIWEIKDWILRAPLEEQQLFAARHGQTPCLLFCSVPDSKAVTPSVHLWTKREFKKIFKDKNYKAETVSVRKRSSEWIEAIHLYNMRTNLFDEGVALGEKPDQWYIRLINLPKLVRSSIVYQRLKKSQFSRYDYEQTETKRKAEIESSSGTGPVLKTNNFLVVHSYPKGYAQRGRPTSTEKKITTLTSDAQRIRMKDAFDLRSVEVQWQVYLSTVGLNEEIIEAMAQNDMCEGEELDVMDFSKRSGNLLTDSAVYVFTDDGKNCSYDLLTRPPAVEDYIQNQILLRQRASVMEAYKKRMKVVFVAWNPKTGISRLHGTLSWQNVEKYFEKHVKLTERQDDAVMSQYIFGLRFQRWDVVSKHIVEDQWKACNKKQWCYSYDKEVYVSQSMFTAYLDIHFETIMPPEGSQWTYKQFEAAILDRLQLYQTVLTRRFHGKMANGKVVNGTSDRTALVLGSAEAAACDNLSFLCIHRSLFLNADASPFDVRNVWLFTEKDLFHFRMGMFTSQFKVNLFRRLVKKIHTQATIQTVGFHAEDSSQATAHALQLMDIAEVPESRRAPLKSKMDEWISKKTHRLRSSIRQRKCVDFEAVWYLIRGTPVGALHTALGSLFTARDIQAGDWVTGIQSQRVCITAHSDTTGETGMLLNSAIMDRYLTQLFYDRVLLPRSHMLGSPCCECSGAEPVIDVFCNRKLGGGCVKCRPEKAKWAQNPWLSHLSRMAVGKFTEFLRETIVVTGVNHTQPRLDLARSASVVELVRHSRLPPSHLIPSASLYPPCMQALRKKYESGEALSTSERTAILAFDYAHHRDQLDHDRWKGTGFESVYEQNKPMLLKQLDSFHYKSIFGPYALGPGDSMDRAPWSCDKMCSQDLCPIAAHQQEQKMDIEDSGDYYASSHSARQTCIKGHYRTAARHYLGVELDEQKAESSKEVFVVGAGKMQLVNNALYSPVDIAQPSDFTIGLLLLKFQQDHPRRRVQEYGKEKSAFRFAWNPAAQPDEQKSSSSSPSAYPTEDSYQSRTLSSSSSSPSSATSFSQYIRSEAIREMKTDSNPNPLKKPRKTAPVKTDDDEEEDSMLPGRHIKLPYATSYTSSSSSSSATAKKAREKLLKSIGYDAPPKDFDSD